MGAQPGQVKVGWDWGWGWSSQAHVIRLHNAKALVGDCGAVLPGQPGSRAA